MLLSAFLRSRCTLVAQPVRLDALHQALTKSAFPGDDISDGEVLSLSSVTLDSILVPSIFVEGSEQLETTNTFDKDNSSSAAVSFQNQDGLGSLSESQEGQGSAAPLRVLIVDDDATQRNLVMHALVSDGFIVDVLGDGFEAVARTARVAYDAILMDGFMPVQV